MIDHEHDPQLRLLAGFLADRGILVPGLTVDQAIDAILDLTRDRLIDRHGSPLPGVSVPSAPDGWATQAALLAEAWVTAEWILNTVKLAKPPEALPDLPATSGAEPLPDFPAKDPLPDLPATTGGEPSPGDDLGPVAPTPPPPPNLDAAASPGGSTSSPGGPATATPQRRLQARVRLPGQAKPLTGGFVAGREHSLAVRIARKASAGTIVADGGFSLLMSKPATLTVLFRLRGSKRPPATTSLELPPSADTAWSTPVTLKLPKATAKVTTAAVEIVVLHQGRAVQTAILSGPLLAAAKPGKGLTLEVDAATPLAAVGQRTPAQATLVVSIPPGGKPVVLDPQAAGITLDSAGLLAAAKAVRSTLHAAFLAPTGTLAGAAPTLTRLAVLGSTLGTVLAASGHPDVGQADWIQIVLLGAADLPFELVYTHPMPDSDDEVPVCGPALSGATRCTKDCADRERSDRVCPFAFWGTSKVIERRVHVPGRVATITNPSVNLADGAVVATSARTDAADPTASQRITDAVATLVPTGRAQRSADWKELAADVAVTPEPSLLVLVTHTETGDPLATTVELGSQALGAHRVTNKVINPDRAEPGPIVLSLGCDTELLDAGFATWVQTLQAAGASVVVSALSPIPGRAVADFVEALASALHEVIDGAGPHRWGAALTAARQRTIAKGGLLALALTSTGDGDIELKGA